MDVPEFYEWRDDIDVVTEVRFLGLCEEVVDNREAPDLMQGKSGWLVAILRYEDGPILALVMETFSILYIQPSRRLYGRLLWWRKSRGKHERNP